MVCWLSLQCYIGSTNLSFPRLEDTINAIFHGDRLILHFSASDNVKNVMRTSVKWLPPLRLVRRLSIWLFLFKLSPATLKQDHSAFRTLFNLRPVPPNLKVCLKCISAIFRIFVPAAKNGHSYAYMHNLIMHCDVCAFRAVIFSTQPLYSFVPDFCAKSINYLACKCKCIS